MPIANVLQAAQKFTSFFQTSKHIYSEFTSLNKLVSPLTNFSDFVKHSEAQENPYLTKLPLHTKSVTNRQFIIKLSLHAMIAIHPLASSLSAVKTSLKEQPHEVLHLSEL